MTSSGNKKTSSDETNSIQLNNNQQVLISTSIKNIPNEQAINNSNNNYNNNIDIVVPSISKLSNK